MLREIVSPQQTSMSTMKSFFVSFFFLITVSLAAQRSDSYTPVAEELVPALVKRAVLEDFPGEYPTSFALLAKDQLYTATIIREESVLLATYSNMALLVSTAERMPMDYLPIDLEEIITEAYPDCEIPYAFVKFRTIVEQDGVVNYRVNLDCTKQCRLIVIDEAGKIIINGYAPAPVLK